MFKKILKWTIYAGVVGLLIFGAVIRTEAKAGQEYPRSETEIGKVTNESLGQGGGAGRSGEEPGRIGVFSGTGEELLLAAEEEHDWISLTGVVTSLDVESLWIEIDQVEPLEITGRAWRYILESGFVLEVGDLVELDGFYENDEFEVSSLMDLTSDESLQIREDSGRPLWSGGAGH